MCLLFLIASVDIKNKCKMCGSTDDGMNNSTCNWVKYTKFYTTSFHCYCVGAWNIASELSTSTKFSCIECTNTAKVSFIH